MALGAALPKKFYKAVAVQPEAEGYSVRLDGRVVRSPAGQPLSAPNEALAKVLAEEWTAQGEHIVAASLRAVRLAFTAIDRVPAARAELAAEVARYAGSDLICYFAASPASLVQRQEALWGPWLEWSAASLGAPLARGQGVTAVEQPAASLARMAELAGALDDFALAGLVHATALYGSAVLAFAVQQGAILGEDALEVSRLDEAFQIEHWGEDAEAMQRTEGLRAEARMIERWFAALRT